jgi:hypothetical protein
VGIRQPLPGGGAMQLIASRKSSAVESAANPSPPGRAATRDRRIMLSRVITHGKDGVKKTKV